MYGKKGFTLIEIIVVMIVMAILAIIALPTYNNYIQQGAAQSAQNNLVAIYNAERNYYFAAGNSTYCTTTTPSSASCPASPNCGKDLAAINCNLSLNIVDNNFTYKCVKGGIPAELFKCIATNNSDNSFTLTMRNIPVIFSGGTGCPSNTSDMPCNPVCAPGANNYCPG
jgi:type IV pilus assembly protein PilE